MADQLPDLDPAAEELFRQFLSQIKGEIPELVPFLNAARDGTLSVEEALFSMVRIVQDNPDKADALVRVADKIAVQERDPSSIGALFQKEHGLPRLNPLYEAALAERIQFDGDIPEARTGPAPKGVK